MESISASPTSSPALPARDRIVIAGALAAVTLLCWAYLVVLAHMAGMAGMDMAGAMGAMPRPWTPVDFALMLAMWWVMMIGMMLPSASPMILMYGRINANRRTNGQPFVPALVFTCGYLLAWAGYSLLATTAQWGLERAAMMAPMDRLASPALGAGLFVLAGVYQLSPLKQACLRHCRSPLSFVLNHWRDGVGGALHMGARHGTYCLGCCALLMALLFAAGVMNLLWVGAIAAFVLVEKLFPGGHGIARASGVAMIAFGLYRLLAM